MHRRGAAADRATSARLPPRPRPPRRRGRHLPRPPPRAQPARARRARARGPRTTPRGSPTTPAAPATTTRSAATRPPPPAPRAPLTGTGRRSSSGRRRWPSARDEEALEGVADRGLPVRPGRSARSRRAARCSSAHADDPLRYGDDLRWLSRLLWWAGRGERGGRGRRAGDRRARGVPGQPRARDGAERAVAAARCCAERHAEAIALGERAAALARALGDDETLAHALTNVGTALIGGADHERGRELLEEAHAHRRRRSATTSTPPARWSTSRPRRFVAPPRRPARRRRHRARARVRARARARRLPPVHARRPREPAPAARRLARRRGRRARLAGVRRAAVREPLPDADRARPPAGAPRRSGGRPRRSTRPGASRSRPASCSASRPSPPSRAENAWLDGALERRAAARGLRAGRRARRALGARRDRVLAAPRRRRRSPPHPDDPEPLRAAPPPGTGAARPTAWRAIGLPYEAALMLAFGDEDDRLEALAVFDELGAARVAAHLRRRLRADGVRRIPRGPRAASRAAPGGPDAARERGARAPARRRHQRGDRPRAGDLTEDRRPPRLGGPGQARRVLAPRAQSGTGRL